MFIQMVQKLFKPHNERLLKKLQPLVHQVNEHEAVIAALSDDELKAKTAAFKSRLALNETLDDLLPEAFAVVREAAKRTIGQRHHDVQLLGGIILHKGMIPEMGTGEGKTLASTLPSYLNALSAHGVHIVTVNDYLAKRDSEWMGTIHRFLGLTVGCVLNDMDDHERQAAYQCDITYATNNELGFDYLRDNMKFRLEDRVQTQFNYAIVDEVDSILIDEARTPLIISGPAEDSSDLYKAADLVIPQLIEGDYEKEEKSRSITLTEQGSHHIEDILLQMGLINGGNLYDIQNISLIHHVNQALKAHKVFNRDVDYIVKDGKVIIIDEFTGRMMDGRRFSDGLHQALEAKERVDIQMENQTLASITFQNYFRLYKKLSGMTGTGKTEAAEFSDIYNLEVAQIPTNLPVARKDYDDEVYRTEAEKITAITKLIKECHDRQQPVLVGTVSIEKSEQLAGYLKKAAIPFQILNARYHESEAHIISQAGKPGAVTIATNMAGRGTDIKLGGNLELRLLDELTEADTGNNRVLKEQKIREEIKQAEAVVKEAGGLFVIGTERHESRRIDNQLRGRSGRQGDPGASKFFLSLQDDLMRRFGSDRLNAMLVRLGLEEGEAITHPWVNKALERAQQKVEAFNYDIRKQLLKYDNVMNDQRKVVYDQRRYLMEHEDAAELINDMRNDVLDDLIARTIPPKSYADQWEISQLHEECLRLFNLNLPIKQWCDEEGIADAEIQSRIDAAIHELRLKKDEKFTPELVRLAEKSILLRILDQNWKDHLLALDHLRQGIGLRGYAQRDPLNEYKQEAFLMFHEMLQKVRETTTFMVSHFELSDQSAAHLTQEPKTPISDKLTYHGPSLDSPELEPKEKTKSDVAKRLRSKKIKTNATASLTELTPESVENLNRNAICPCGAGKRFKHCHGQIHQIN